MKIFILICLAFILNACETVYYPMTYQQMSRIKQGMTPDEVVAIRGQPMKMSVRTMGRNHPNGVWQGLVYCYKLTEGSYDLFYFDMSSNPNRTFLVEWELNCNSTLCHCEIQ
jgi:hypothetical protein